MCTVERERERERERVTRAYAVAACLSFDERSWVRIPDQCL